jgi:hypothetical protein
VCEQLTLSLQSANEAVERLKADIIQQHEDAECEKARLRCAESGGTGARGHRIGR